MRGALHMLQREGYIVSTSGNGAKTRLTVAPLTKEDARELYSIVGHLEGLAAWSTARLPPEARAAVVKKLKELNDGLRDLAETGRQDPNRIFELDMTFHQTIVDASAGPRLRALHSAIKPQTERYWRLYASAIFNQLGISVGEHLAIIQGIEVKTDYFFGKIAELHPWALESFRGTLPTKAKTSRFISLSSPALS